VEQKGSMKIGKYDLRYDKFPHYKKLLGRKFINNMQTKPVFVVGNQRSGTTMLLSKLNRHFWVDIFHESSNAMIDWELKSFIELDKIISNSKAKVCIFKPLEETHRVNDLLEYFKDSKAIFIFRHYSDVINSSMKLGWGRHLKQYIQNINDGTKFKYSGPLNLTEKNARLIRELYHDDLTEESCVALIWYLRNTIYPDYILRDDPRVLLTQYEKVVTDPKKEMERILSFMDLRPSKSVFYKIVIKSIRKESQPQIDERIENICNEMFEILVALVP